MKKITYLFAILFLGLFANAQEESFGERTTETVMDQVQGADISFEAVLIDYGTIAQNSDGVRVFKYTNTGTEPLKIVNAKGSCGCTVPEWSKDELAPGQSAEIRVKYATNRLGRFNKTVTLTHNGVNGPTTVLTIKGNVLNAEAPATFPEVNN